MSEELDIVVHGTTPDDGKFGFIVYERDNPDILYAFENVNTSLTPDGKVKLDATITVTAPKLSKIDKETVDKRAQEILEYLFLHATGAELTAAK